MKKMCMLIVLALCWTVGWSQNTINNWNCCNGSGSNGKSIPTPRLTKLEKDNVKNKADIENIKRRQDEQDRINAERQAATGTFKTDATTTNTSSIIDKTSTSTSGNQAYIVVKDNSGQSHYRGYGLLKFAEGFLIGSTATMIVCGIKNRCWERSSGGNTNSSSNTNTNNTNTNPGTTSTNGSGGPSGFSVIP